MTEEVFLVTPDRYAASLTAAEAKGVEESARWLEGLASIWQQAEEPERARKLRGYAQDLRVFVAQPGTITTNPRS